MTFFRVSIPELPTSNTFLHDALYKHAAMENEMIGVCGL